MAEHSKQSADGAPRAIIHKRILDAARDDPTASIEGIADDIAAATPELVEKVLDEYGDPGTAEAAQSTETDGTADSLDESVASEDDELTTASETAASASAVSTDGGDAEADAHSSIDRNELSSAQTETLRAIARRPSATQAEIADELGVVRATVCNRLRELDGFDWKSRERFVATLFDDLDGAEQPEPAAASTPDGSESSTDDDETASGRDDEPSASAVDASADADTASADDASPTEPTAEEAETADTAGGDDNEVASRLAALETTVASLEAGEATAAEGTAATTLSRADGGTTTDGADPELLHKAVQAIVDDDRISETEEIRLLRHVL